MKMTAGIRMQALSHGEDEKNDYNGCCDGTDLPRTSTSSDTQKTAKSSYEAT